jgi:hypothetical protein
MTRSRDVANIDGLLTTTGDTYYASAASTPARLGIGSTGNVLTVAGGVPTWAAPAGGGKVLQVVQGTTSTEKSIASTSFTDTNLTVTITPSSTSSKIMILASQSVYLGSGTTEWVNIGLRLMRGGTSVLDYSGSYDQANAIYTETVSGTTYATLAIYTPITYLDSPSTTSATTYKTQIKMSSTADGRVAFTQQAGSTSSIIALEIGA